MHVDFSPEKAFKAWLAMGGKLREEEIRPNWHLLKCLTPEGKFYAAMIYCEETNKKMFMATQESYLSEMIADFLNRYDAGELD